jgi:histidine phosphotransferase ChpT
MTQTSTSTIAPELLDPTLDPPAAISPVELAAFLAARMCHDYVSPAGAIMSGLDLLEDPSAQDMREEAMTLIASSAKKLVDVLSFDRVALGASAAAETFGADQLETLAVGVSSHGRAKLVWNVTPRTLPKPAARALLNLVQIGLGALPTGGTATLTAVEVGGGQGEDGALVLAIDCVGARARLRPSVIDGLQGRRLVEGLAGLWVQAYYLHELVVAAGGTLEHEVFEERVMLTVKLPA